MIKGAIETYVIFRFLRRLVRPFERWDAFRTGVIDKNGDILVPPEKRNDAQNQSFTRFDVLIRNIKRLLMKLPGGNSKLATFGAVLFLLKEDTQDIAEKDLEMRFKEFLEELDLEEVRKLIEDAPTNSVGDGTAMSVNEPKMFGNAAVFDVDDDKLWKSRYGKHPRHRYSRYVGEDEVGEEIRQYSRSNPGKSVILRNSRTGAMVYLRKK